MRNAIMWSPLGDCHLALTSGHTFVVPNDPAGIAVPRRFRHAARSRGCLPVEVLAKLGVRDGVEPLRDPSVVVPDQRRANGVGVSVTSVVGRIAHSLREAGDVGLSRSMLRMQVRPQVSASELNGALVAMLDAGAVTCKRVATGGRPREMWRLTEVARELAHDLAQAGE